MPPKTRLHISPLDPTLLPLILPPHLLAHATSISYHHLSTFPDRPYGYLDLLNADATTLTQRLHGTILRGAKMRVEAARPERRRAMRSDAAAGSETVEEAKNEALVGRARRKPEANVIPAIQLPGERKVKRGWAEPSTDATKGKQLGKEKDGKKARKEKAVKSTFTEGSECLFRTKVPGAGEVDSMGPPGLESKSKKRKLDGEKEVVVHEFANTMKHGTFLREGARAGEKAVTTEFVEGKGWVDGSGKVIEEAPKRLRRTSRRRAKEVAQVQQQRDQEQENEEEQQNMGDENGSKSKTTYTTIGTKDHEEDEAISSTNSSPPPTLPTIANDKPTTANQSLATTALKTTPPPKPSSISTMSTTPTTTLHPLEALFKRPKPSTDTSKRPPNLELAIPFSFFDSPTPASSARAFGGGGGGMPQTPFTQRDLQWRGMRSAAPTPDTAAPRRASFGFGFGMGEEVEGVDGEEEEEEERRALEAVGEDDEEDEDGNEHEDNADDAEDDAGDEDADVEEQRDRDEYESQNAQEAVQEGMSSQKIKSEKKDGGEKAESDFSKWFWEHRGETNRAWKQRRREASKDKRQRENRRKTRSAAL